MPRVREHGIAKWPMAYRCKRWLRRHFYRKCYVLVGDIDGGDDEVTYGDITWRRGKPPLIRLSPHQTEEQAVDTLLHEWAHLISGDSDHGIGFASAFAGLAKRWRSFHARTRTSRSSGKGRRSSSRPAG